MRGDLITLVSSPTSFRVEFKPSKGILRVYNKTTKQAMDVDLNIDASKRVKGKHSDFLPNFYYIERVFFYSGMNFVTSTYRKKTDVVAAYVTTLGGSKKIKVGTVERLREDGFFSYNKAVCNTRIICMLSDYTLATLDMPASGRNAFMKFVDNYDRANGKGSFERDGVDFRISGVNKMADSNNFEPIFEQIQISDLPQGKEKIIEAIAIWLSYCKLLRPQPTFTNYEDVDSDSGFPENEPDSY